MRPACRRCTWAAAAGLLAVVSCGLVQPPAGEQVGASTLLFIQSPAFNDQGPIPAKYTIDDADISPPLVWSSPPEGTVEEALTMVDLDTGEFPVHWIMYKIQPLPVNLPEGIPTASVLSFPVSALQGLNSAGTFGYLGPRPAAGQQHHYQFTIYALDTTLNLSSGVELPTLLSAMQGHIIQQASLVGVYERQDPSPPVGQ
jgi:Raf kinase inhibitor-like YbhB/YbcL family protein